MKRVGWIIAACLVLVLGILAAFFAARPSYVLTSDRLSLNSTEFSYFYWSEFFYFQDAYGEYLSGSVDFTKPLDQQAYSESRSWQEHLTEEALTVAADTLSMALAAEDAGFTMPQDYLETFNAVWESFVLASGGDLDGYLQQSYGKNADQESFRLYLFRSHLAAAYADSLYAALDPSAEAVAAYYEDHAGIYLDEYGLTAEDDWQSRAREDLLYELNQEQIRKIRAQYPFEVNYDAVKLVPPAGLYEDK